MYEWNHYLNKLLQWFCKFCDSRVVSLKVESVI